jgi:hypothetical protein
MSVFHVGRRPMPSDVQRAWLRRGLDEPGGKLPLFDEYGKQIDPRTVQACIEQGWAEPWFKNPLKSDWLVCKLTPAGRAVTTLKSAPVIPLRSARDVEKTII